MAEASVSAYNEETGRGIVRHLAVRSSPGGEVASVVINAEGIPGAARLTARFREIPGIAGVCVNINKNKGNVILGGETRTLWGRGYSEFRVCGVSLRAGADAFFQVNAPVAERLYSAALNMASPEKNDSAADLYCGVGCAALIFAGGVKRVVGVEINPAAVRDACGNAEANGAANAEFFAADCAEWLAGSGFKPDIAVLDPPRSGAAPAVIKSLIEAAPRKIIYISCDPATLARDIKILADSGGYRLTAAQPADMFPQTGHTETAAALERG
jgi:23S rRNA (uracil1939-C5)-methyltransferase